MTHYIIITLVTLVTLFVLGIFGFTLWTHFVTTVVVRQHEAVLLFRHGKLIKQLDAGRHRVFGSGYDVERFDTRWTDMALQGQEFLTADKASVKVSGFVRYRIADAAAYQASSDQPVSSLYLSVQLALREVIGGQDLEAVLDRKTILSKALVELAQPAAEKLGIELDTVAVKDLVLTGELKRVFTDALTVKQQSLITLEKARAEAAAMRTLANGARVLETHPALLQLKFLQALETADGGIAQPLALGAAGQWLDFIKK
ncbi:slipin family protein [Haloferula sp.]|uniref:slipin family protein n=1 Tax=Haloferula sp. TaxID=2497595 RepID=UPI0032A11EE2